jgi:hypothetical protein
MNAVRIRKENQIYSAEEKRALSAVNFEEKLAKESRQLDKWNQVIANQRKRTN